MIRRYTKIAGIHQHNHAAYVQTLLRSRFLLEQDVRYQVYTADAGAQLYQYDGDIYHVSNAKQKDILVNRHPRNLMEVNGG